MAIIANKNVVRLPVSQNSAQYKNINFVEALEFQKIIFEIQEKLPIYYFVKVVVETFIAGLLLFFLSPVMLTVAAIIRWRMGGPVLYKQLRVGINGKLFWAYKFRTMRNNSPRVVEMGFKALEKVSHDPRVEGRLGKFLRKWKWDELPQLFNVIKGDMVLIGPRPYLLEENFHFKIRHIGRFSVRPGISGLWQARNTGINNPQLKAKLDAYYVRKLSLKTDLWIWMRTFYILSIGEKL